MIPDALGDPVLLQVFGQGILQIHERSDRVAERLRFSEGIKKDYIEI